MEDNKKPGQRDISDLKARLGLKKTASMPAVAPPGQAQSPAPQAIPAPLPSPSGSHAPVAQPIPSPFGTPAPQPQATPAPAPPPDPRRDPFAQQQAANLAAFYGIGQQIPGDASGVDATPITKPKPLATIGILAIAGVVVFGVGNACGRVYASRVDFNRTIDEATEIRDEVDKLGKQLNGIADVLNASKLTTQGQPDFDMTKKLADLDLKKPDTQRIFHTNYYHFEDAAIERLFNYYDHTIKLYDAITLHGKKTLNDQQAIDSAAKSAATKGDKNYAVTLDFSGPIPFAHFVELGSPECPKPDQTDCPANELKGFKYRTDSGGAWAVKPVKGKPTEIVIPMQKGALFATVAAGNPDILAFKDYFRRVAEIKGLAQGLVLEQKDLLGDLKKTAERSKVFVF